ncbi:MAG: hypothetical protein OHK0046_13750 [Anaerolineae bacterium]
MASIFQQILQVQAQMQALLLVLPNVVGVAVGYKESNGVLTTEPSLVVLVQQKKPLAGLTEEQQVPREINGVPTDVREVGYIQAQQTDPRSRFRPIIPSGVSIGHYKVTAGTLGAMVRDRTTGERLLLSNNHVLANSNEAMQGDDILQPGATDGGQRPSDVVAKLERFIALRYVEDAEEPAPTPTPSPGNGNAPSGCDIVDVLVGMSNLFASASGSGKRVAATSASGAASSSAAVPAPQAAAQATERTNLVDAALGRPINPDMFSDEILNIGVITGTKPPALEMQVRKMGRTTGLTRSRVTLLNATINVAYNTSQGARTARFTGQVICDPMSQGGDSGSLVVDANSQSAVGLLFAGSPLATLFTPIDVVANALNIRFGL